MSRETEGPLTRTLLVNARVRADLDEAARLGRELAEEGAAPSPPCLTAANVIAAIAATEAEGLVGCGLCYDAGDDAPTCWAVFSTDALADPARTVVIPICPDCAADRHATHARLRRLLGLAMALHGMGLEGPSIIRGGVLAPPPSRPALPAPPPALPPTRAEPPRLLPAPAAVVAPSAAIAASASASVLVAEARAAMEAVLARHPTLGPNGFARRPRSGEEAARQREAMMAPDALAAFTSARGWFRRWRKWEPLSEAPPLRRLRQAAANDIGFLPAGPFVAAAVAEGFRVRRDGPTNVLVGINPKAFDW